jgi:integrase
MAALRFLYADGTNQVAEEVIGDQGNQATARIKGSQMRVALTDKFCARARSGEWFDEKATGLALWVGKNRNTWNLHFSKVRKRGRIALGHYPAITLAAARRAALEGKDKAEAGEPIKADFVGAMLDEFFLRYAESLRSAAYVQDVIERLVKPEIGGIALSDIRRSHVAAMLDKIADKNGPVMADRTLAIVRKAFNWRAARDDDFVVPIAKGMARTKPRERQRDRILTDAGLRSVWNAKTEGSLATFQRYVRVLLLTALRRKEASKGHRREVKDGLWLIPAERMVGKIEFVVPLTDAALAQLGDAKGFLFSTDAGSTPISGFSKFKTSLDEACGVKDWTPHDLRRIARSLMCRAGVSADIAERCLAHKVGGIRGVSDRDTDFAEKRDALGRVAALVGEIVK